MTRYSADGEEWYLFTYSTNDNITLRRSKALTDNWDNQETRVVFNPEPSGQDSGQPWSTDLWVGCFSPFQPSLPGTWQEKSRSKLVRAIDTVQAPEIHNISGKWYIIFSATPDFDNPPPLQDAACPINCVGTVCQRRLSDPGSSRASAGSLGSSAASYVLSQCTKA